MLLARMYSVAWILSILIFLVTYLTGLLRPIAMIAFGKFFIGLIFIGMIAVLPSIAGSLSPQE